MGEAVIEVRGLRKRYGELEAVRGVDLRIERGEVFALLGPNGAGKTTTVEILEGHRDRSAGDVSVLGYDPGRHEVALKERRGGGRGGHQKTRRGWGAENRGRSRT